MMNASTNTSSYLKLVCTNGTDCELYTTSVCNQTIAVRCIGTMCRGLEQQLFTSTHVQYIATTAHVCPTTYTSSIALHSERIVVVTQTRNHTIQESLTVKPKNCPVSTTTVSMSPHTEYIHTCTANISVTPSTPTNQNDETVGGLAVFIAVQFLALIAVTTGWVCTCIQIKLKRSRKCTVT